MKNIILLSFVLIAFYNCSLDTKIIQATKEKNVEKVKSLIAKGENVNAVGECYNALSIAVFDDNMELIELLLSSGSNPNVRNYECVRRLPHIGKFPIGRDTALAYSKNLESTKALMEAGADPNILDIDGNSPLYKAIIKGLPDIVEYLIAHGANVNLFTKEGKNLHLNAINLIQKSKPNESEKILKLLVAADAKDFDFNSVKTDTTVHDTYLHKICKSTTKMDRNIAEAVTNNPSRFSQLTFCTAERAFSHYSEFHWTDNDQNMMHWYIKRLKDTKPVAPIK
ncbi:hypothetical protein A0128_01820 [Leptospira tipperaryensis]|uniref:Uncharacterized protein n=1 Tax=Leptospira tipperaryensis TaxID=2564040 RepID=A0A1D7USW6_9LEPT|nr:ankyrin repeat domain-containing protein [Leptospira tipperaryensis]AOP32717.1 hypothetical protein A0128_01820 [Leptospira tipperaryensis]